MSEATEGEIWREGDRIVSRECGGFVDGVSDENLARFATDETSHPVDRAFAAATLAVREFERAARDYRASRRASVSA